jgi:hypothetical protein
VDKQEKIQQVFNQFRTEEVGNRLSQFALAGLLELVLQILNADEPKPEDKKEKQDE